MSLSFIGNPAAQEIWQAPAQATSRGTPPAFKDRRSGGASVSNRSSSLKGKAGGYAWEGIASSNQTPH